MITDVGKFQDCTIKSDKSCYAVLDLSRTVRGWICYNVKDSKNLLKEHCVIAESTENSKGYYILIVRPTTVDSKYVRVRIGQVSKNCLVRTQANVRVV